MTTANRVSSPVPVPPPRARAGLLSRGLFLLGTAMLAYLLGAAVIFFALPGSTVLTRAFVGARAWAERRKLDANAVNQEPASVHVGDINQPDKTCAGYNLISCANPEGPSNLAVLTDMGAHVVHRWQMPFSQVFPDPPPGHGYLDDSLFCFFGCHLYPNGDLLVTYHTKERFSWGYGLVKLDKDSKVLWKYAAPVHHDVDVGEDGTIYAIQQEQVSQLPRGLEYLPTPCLVDSLIQLSPDGKPRGTPLSILKALQESPYAPLLSTLERAPTDDAPPPDDFPARFDRLVQIHDPVHTNSVRVLTRKLAPHFPQFKPGQVLISLREADIVAVLDLSERRVVWATRGAWRRQHDAQFLDNGHLLVFDNHGSARCSRVLEYDPQTGAFPWSYTDENLAGPYHTNARGMCQRLPNGNTLIVDSTGCQLLEVTRDKEPVWTCTTGAFVTTGRRYLPDQLPFLEGDQRARP